MICTACQRSTTQPQPPYPAGYEAMPDGSILCFPCAEARQAARHLNRRQTPNGPATDRITKGVTSKAKRGT